FPATVDFITSPGQDGKYGSRRELDLPGGGPVRVVTDVGILAPSQSDGELELVGLYPGVSIDEVKAKTGWPLRVAQQIEQLLAPTAHELHLLRDVLDPSRLFLK
ncbi:MAG: CoA-transferase subunit beta, partial [Candidatus Eremiobacteraeota bacterium]|nr:CoA-transferase subunit beta [Candidatus Eremiobacteraeota bacterium]